MEPQNRNLSPWIAWSLVALFAGIAAFVTWYYYDQAATAWDDSATFFGLNVHKNTTASWKTYTDDKYSYSFKYPTTYNLANVDATVLPKTSHVIQGVFVGKSSGTVVFGVNVLNIAFSTDAIKQQYTASSTTTVTSTTISGEKAYKAVNSESTTTDYYLQDSSGKVIYVYLSRDTEATKILSTLQFAK